MHSILPTQTILFTSVESRNFTRGEEVTEQHLNCLFCLWIEVRCFIFCSIWVLRFKSCKSQQTHFVFSLSPHIHLSGSYTDREIETASISFKINTPLLSIIITLMKGTVMFLLVVYLFTLYKSYQPSLHTAHVTKSYFKEECFSALCQTTFKP